MAYYLARVPPAMMGKEGMEAIQGAAPDLFIETNEFWGELQRSCEEKGIVGPLDKSK